jgi:uncharacterized protein (TIGR00369 family)
MSAAPPDGHVADDGPNAELQASIAEAVSSFVPHNRALGMKLVSCIGGRVTVTLPWSEKIVGNPATRVIHGGAITTLCDATCGTAVFVKLLEPIPIATLDLRIDYLRPATPEREVHARAECYKVTRTVAFVRCEAFHPDAEGDLVATATGTFMLFRGRSLGSRRRKKP